MGDQDERVADLGQAIDTTGVPPKFKAAFERGVMDRLQVNPEADYKSAERQMYWRQGWEAAEGLLKADAQIHEERALQPEKALAVRRDRRDAWRLRAEVVMALGGLGAIVSAFFLWTQVQQQTADTLIVRRAQLLDTIYGQVCDDERTGDPQPLEESEQGAASEPACRPKAHVRARQEAVLAFIEIEREHRDADLAWANLSEMDLSKADLRAGSRIIPDLSSHFNH